MNEENKIILEANDADGIHAFTEGETPDKREGFSHEYICDDYNDVSFERLFLQIKERCKCSRSIYEFEIDKKLMQNLGKLLKTEDYESDLFQEWLLKTIIREIELFSEEIHRFHYENFILWLFEEIIIVHNNPDITRAKFFTIMSKIFYEMLKDILNGKGLSHPSKYLTYFCFDEMQSEIGSEENFTESNFQNRLDPLVFDNEETETNTWLVSTTSNYDFDSHERSLHALIEATYQIFGCEVTYSLIQLSNNQEECLYYEIPYHFRKPRVVKRTEPIKQIPIANQKSEKTKKKRKSSLKVPKKEPSDGSLSFSMGHAQPNIHLDFILPLSEAIESSNVMNLTSNSCIDKVSI